MLKLLAHGFWILLLTAVTQIGGLAWLAALLLRRMMFRRARRPVIALAGLFLLCYGAGSLVVQITAPLVGRTALPCWPTDDASLAMATPAYCLLNRHYVSAPTHDLVERLAGHMEARFPGTLTQTLDAGFPFLNGFPLLPHLSHDDGRKLDLALYYRNSEGSYRRGLLASPVGYWGFAPPQPGEPQPCADADSFLALRWDMSWFQLFVRDDVTLDETRTRAALEWLVAEGKSGGRLSRILLEPHLKSRLGLVSDRIRFQGCRAARHDDHIHIESRN